MGESSGAQNYPYGIDWTSYNQMKLQIESAQREKTYNEIKKVLERAREREVDPKFISGLELASEIALFGAESLARRKQNEEEDIYG